MARSKVKCKGKTKEGSSCNNWASEGSYYCHLHQDQVTTEDVKQKEEERNIANIIMIVIAAFIFLFAMATGCEKEAVDWFTR